MKAAGAVMYAHIVVYKPSCEHSHGEIEQSLFLRLL